MLGADYVIMSDSGYIWLLVAVFGCFLGVYWVFYGILSVNGCVGVFSRVLMFSRCFGVLAGC